MMHGRTFARLTVRRALAAAPAALAAMLVPAPAAAVQVGNDGGFFAGLLHPILGFDHLLAMVAVGLLSVQLGGRAIWNVPAAFLLFLVVGGALGLVGVPLLEVEGMIALSVLALGLAIAARASMPTVLAMGLVAVFAVFHGHAHGAEIPRLAAPAAYVAGFALASAGLHLTGVTIGMLGRRPQLRALLGAGVAGIGLHMVLLTYSVI
jgi:urease accessory protein